MFDKRYVMGGDAANYSCGLKHHQRSFTGNFFNDPKKITFEAICSHVII
jgi:hypothetical protein